MLSIYRFTQKCVCKQNCEKPWIVTTDLLPTDDTLLQVEAIHSESVWDSVASIKLKGPKGIYIHWAINVVEKYAKRIRLI